MRESALGCAFGGHDVRRSGMKPSRPTRKIIGKAERAELARQGAKAAARGEQRSSNPMAPTADVQDTTDAPLVDDLRARSDAWQQGYDQQSESNEARRPPTSQGRDDEHD